MKRFLLTSTIFVSFAFINSAASAAFTPIDLSQPYIGTLDANSSSPISSGYNLSFTEVTNAADIAANRYKFVSYTMDSDYNTTPHYYNYTYTLTGSSGAPINNNIDTDTISGYFFNKTATSITNNATINDIYADFAKNAYASIENTQNNTIGNIWGDSIDNTGINNNYGKIESINGNFIGSTWYSIYNRGLPYQVPDLNTYITSINGNFINNYQPSIYNSKAYIYNINASFIANSGFYPTLFNDGGYIENINASFIGNLNISLANTGSKDSGYTIPCEGYNTCGLIKNVSALFLENHTTRDSSSTLSNNRIIENINNSLFINNSVDAPYSAQGGAINNSYVIENINNSLFYGNSVKALTGNAKGGAIYNMVYNDNDGTIGKILNSSFYNNSATIESGTTLGGAIYSNKDISIEASGAGKVSEFKGNYTQVVGGEKDYNAIYMDSTYWTSIPSTLTLNANNGGTINFYDNIRGKDGYSIKLENDNTGTINFFAPIYDANIINDGVFSAGGLNAPGTVNFANAALLNNNNSLTLNGGITNILDFGTTALIYKNIDLNGGLLNAYNVGVNLENKEMGTLSSVNTPTGNLSDIIVKSVMVEKDGADLVTHVPFTDSNLIAGQTASEVSEAMGDVFKYDVDYDKDTGDFIFSRRQGGGGDNFNPEVLNSAVGNVVAASILSDEIYSRVLADVDNSCGEASCLRAPAKAWVKPFGSHDTVNLKNLSANADTQFMGIIGGIESNKIDEGKGISGIYTAYGAYANGKTEFEGNTVNQDAGYIGLGATFYKDAFFLGTTANIGMISSQADTPDGTDKFNTYLGGLATKAGYNYEIFETIFQPSLYGSYTYLNSEDYVTKRGTEITMDDSHIFEFAFGMKIIKELEEHLNIYLTSKYVWRFYSGQDNYANNFALPEIGAEPFVEYGLGFSKEIAQYSYFMEVTRRDGGRTGWNGLVGFKYAF